MKKLLLLFLLIPQNIRAQTERLVVLTPNTEIFSNSIPNISSGGKMPFIGNFPDGFQAVDTSQVSDSLEKHPDISSKKDFFIKLFKKPLFQ